ncbi:transcriptional regulator, TetR family [Rhizobiales bacterium GAS188]|nr:transcriptional regulator, TetR family [Rhizobiales bacterium GAS188]
MSLNMCVLCHPWLRGKTLHPSVDTCKTVGHLAFMIARSKRTEIVERGLDLVHRGSFASSGVAAITAAAGAPKGSFYNHFESKTAFGIAIVDQYFDNVRSTLGSILSENTDQPIFGIRRYFSLLRELGARDRYARGCLIGNLGAESSSAEDAIRLHLNRRLAEWTSILTTAVAAAQRAGEARRDVPAAVLAAILLDAWQGALLRAKVERKPAGLDAFLDVLLPALLGQASA